MVLKYCRMGAPVPYLLVSVAYVVSRAALWWAGLPFVFAFWAGKPGAVTANQVARLQEALGAGLAAIRRIASTYNGYGSGHAVENEAYLRQHIVYRLGEPELQGLREFYRRAHALGLIPRLPVLRFHASS